MWVFFILVLSGFFIFNTYETIIDYYKHTVITTITSINENPMQLPAVTLCLISMPFFSSNLTLDKFLFECSIADTVCDYKDFRSFEIRTSFAVNNYNPLLMTCFSLNNGRNFSGHANDIKSVTHSEISSAFNFSFYLEKQDILIYYINEAGIKPTSRELDQRFFLPGSFNTLILEKIIESKLELPYNDCYNRENLPDTNYVRQLAEANITYRQINCFELCYQDYLKNYAIENNITEDQAATRKEVRVFDTEKNCKKFCPLECKNTDYKITGTKFYTTDLFKMDYYFEILNEKARKTLKKHINSTEESKKNFVQVKITYDSLRYIKISQTPKTTIYDLISNVGGASGLFMELSFLTIFKVIEFILMIIFKF